MSLTAIPNNNYKLSAWVCSSHCGSNTFNTTSSTIEITLYSDTLDLRAEFVQTQSYTVTVTAQNSSNYSLTGTDRNGQVSGNDPGITINLGDTLTFNVSAQGHPFYLKTQATTGTGNQVSGATNQGTQNGTVTWTPTSAGTYYYICSLHGGMVGTITVN